MERQQMTMKKEEFGSGVAIVGNRCYRCGYSWIPRDLKDIPETCPSCRSPYWRKAKVRFKKNKKGGKTNDGKNVS